MEIPVNELQLFFFWENLIKISDCISKFTAQHHFSWPFLNSLHRLRTYTKLNKLHTALSNNMDMKGIIVVYHVSPPFPLIWV